MRPRRGFTLVELLVVIAILGILAGFVAAGLPGVLRRAKIASTKNTFNQIRTSLVAYYTDNNSLPPAYGYLSNLFLKDFTYSDPSTRPQDIINALVNGTNGMEMRDAYFLVPWMSAFREHGNEDIYDNWSRSSGYDTDGDDALSRLEYAPIGIHEPVSNVYTFNFPYRYAGPVPPPYDEDDPVVMDMAEQLRSPGPRPFIYIPVNERQTRIFRTIIYNMANRMGNQSDPRPLNLDAQAIADIEAQLSFPPASYDAFVLISVGPNFISGTNGIIVDYDTMGLGNFNPQYSEVYQYHLLALATYFMATRDAENNGAGDGELDFDFEARASRGQGKISDNDMPGSQPKGDGPLIYKGNI